MFLNRFFRHIRVGGGAAVVDFISFRTEFRTVSDSSGVIPKMAVQVTRAIRKCRGIVMDATKILTPAARNLQSKATNSTAFSLEMVRHMQELALLYPQADIPVGQVEDHQVAAVQNALDIVNTLCEIELVNLDPLYVLPSVTHLCWDDVAVLRQEEWESLRNSQCHKEGYFITAPIPAANQHGQ